jgi:hypothetical protein
VRDKIHIILVYIPIHKTFPLIQSETKEENRSKTKILSVTRPIESS